MLFRDLCASIPPSLRSAFVVAALASSAIACGAAEPVDLSEGDLDEEVDNESELGTVSSELQSSVDCSTERMDAYSGGNRIGTVDVIRVGGKRVTKSVGQAFLKFQRAAASAGVDVGLNSAFRTMAEQRYFYGCYQSGSCNSGNLAARPGYSNHQSGRAIDISNSRSSWVVANASRFGFKRTVPSEPWHFEYTGADPGGPCGSGATPAPSAPSAIGEGCYSATLKRDVSENTCVQARSNSIWYRCIDGAWSETRSSDTACSVRHAL
jgi:hypothetical protein